MRYYIAPSVVGKWLVIDSHDRYATVASGLTKDEALAWAARLNHRQAWGS